MGGFGRGWRLAATGAVSMLLACSQVGVSFVQRGDTFVQGGGPVTVDIVWVVDGSGTMSEEQDALAHSVGPFVRGLLEQDLDFHLGVLSMDMDDPEHSGRLIGSPAWLERSTPDLEAEFRARALLGVGGSRDERAFDALRAALSDPLGSDANAGFLRSNAELAIILFSDEDDQSGITVGTIQAFLMELKDGLEVTVSGFVGDVPVGCASLTGAADPAPLFLELISGLSGISSSICSAPYEEPLTRMVGLLSHIQDIFVLSDIPDPESIKVEVEGVILREREIDGWMYLPDRNAIRISGTPLPLPGQTIEVTYDRLRF